MSDIAQTPPKFNSLELACAYVKQHPGRYLFPIKPAAKFPPLEKGNLSTNASNDPAQIAKWVEKFTDKKTGMGPNWGLALKKSGLFVADIDTNPKKGKVGQATYDELDLLYGWPDTETVRTPSGGFHKYYEGEHRFALGKYGLGQDIDSPNYVLIAGCTFDDGTSYVTENDNVPTAPKPDWFEVVITGSKKVRVENATKAAIELDKDSQIAWAKDYLLNDAEPSIEGKGGENTTFRVACSVKDCGVSRETAVELMLEYYNVEFVCEPLWERADLEKKIANAYDYGSLSQVGGKSAEAEFGNDDVAEIANSISTDIMGNRDAEGQRQKDKPRIIVDLGKLPEIARKVQRLLIKDGKRKDTAASDQIFQRSGSLVHVSRNRLDPTDKDYDMHFHVENDLVVLPVEHAWFADRLERSFEFGRLGKKKGENGRSKKHFIAQPCPKFLIDRLLAIRQDWQYPNLVGIIETPTLRLDGSILSKPGYDVVSGLYFDPGRAIFPAPIDRPTPQDVTAAHLRIREVLKDFPFADDDDTVTEDTVSGSVALALLLLSVCRRIFPIAPMFGIDANTAQSGKTELAQVAAIIATGRETACRPLGHDEYQRENALAAAFEAGDAVLLFDNIDGNKQNVEGEGLCKAMTSAAIQTRRLGGNSAADQVSAPTNSLLIATGNKLTFAGDMAEDRALIINLRPDKPLAERFFSHAPLNQYVIDNRPQIVMDLLTILRGYHLADDKRPGRTFRFAQFRAKIADAVVWLGLPDPIQSTERVKDEDPISESQRDVLQAWVSHFGDKAMTVGKAIENGDIAKAIADARGIDVRHLSKEKAGLYLKGMLGITLSGYRMTRIKDKHTKSSAYQAVLTAGATPIDPVAPAEQGDAEVDFGFADETMLVEYDPAA
jgi:hypothetical protein